MPSPTVPHQQVTECLHTHTRLKHFKVYISETNADWTKGQDIFLYFPFAYL